MFSFTSIPEVFHHFSFQCFHPKSHSQHSKVIESGHSAEEKDAKKKMKKDPERSPHSKTNNKKVYQLNHIN